MNAFLKLFKKIRDGGERSHETTALVIATTLTVIVGYFILMYWCSLFIGNLSGQEKRPLANEVTEVNILIQLKNKVKSIFKNEEISPSI